MILNRLSESYACCLIRTKDCLSISNITLRPQQYKLKAMADTKRIPLFAISMFLLSSIFYARVESVDILNLRRGRNTGPSGRFAVPRHFLEDELKRLGLSGEHVLV